MKTKRNNRQFYLIYTALFVILTFAVFFWFIWNGKSFIWNDCDHDGLVQHYNAFAYYGKLLREVLKTLIFEHRLELPMWDMSIGYGSDIITTLHYYAVGDPLNLLSAFVPLAWSEYLFNFMVLLRLYLAGIAFSRYCFYHDKQRKAILIGMFLYVFAAYSLTLALRHPFFLNVLIYFPFMLLGVDKILDKKKPYVFILSVSILALCSFYFFYMASILVFIYAVIRYFTVFGKFEWKHCLLNVAKCIAFYGIGIMIASLVFLPVVMNMFASQRANASNYVPVLYNFDYYRNMWSNLLSVGNIGYNNIMGYSPLFILSLGLLFAKKGKKNLKIIFLILIGFLFIPFVGHVMNGFSYVTNRWIWALQMFAAYLCVSMLPALLRMERGEKIRVMIFCSVYTFGCFLKDGLSVQIAVALILLFMMAVLFFLVDGTDAYQRKATVVIGVLAGIGIVMNARSIFDSSYIDTFVDTGTAYESLTENLPTEAVRSTGDKGVYRYDQFRTGETHNTSMQTGTEGVRSYYSLSNGLIGKFYNEMYLNFPYEMITNDLDSRTILDSLAAVKYFVVEEGQSQHLPYSFRKAEGSTNVSTVVDGKEGKTEYVAYKNRDSLPIAYTYDSYISRTDYEKMDVVEKQKALLQGVVLEESTLPKTDIVLDAIKSDYTMKLSEGVSFKNNTFTVTKERAVVTLEFSPVKEAENYLIFDNLHYEGISPMDLYAEKEWNLLSTYQKHLVQKEQREWIPSTGATVWVSSGSVSKVVSPRNNRHDYYSGRHNFLCNMGYRKNGINQIKLTFSNTGIYNFGQLRVVSQPVEQIHSYIEERKTSSLTDVKMSVNTLSGKINLEKKKVLCFALPYSQGWKAYVDGKEQEVFNANTMHMALELESGVHDIKLVYETPHIRLFLGITVMGIFLLMICTLYYEHKKKDVL